MADPEMIFVEVALPPDLVGALDAFVSAHPGMTRPGALAAAFRDWAIGQGYLRLEDAEQGMRPEELNAANDD